jgi:hypothetical protein
VNEENITPQGGGSYQLSNTKHLQQPSKLYQKHHLKIAVLVKFLYEWEGVRQCMWVISGH